ncbi:nitrate ABC transporter substrate-binding protein [Acinetobacter sp. ANC 4558]|uniref:ABC transporter substrate-binding protein n=1 Tax=Acinetobacter sp. ANC 4558 TaxID=1977876 RepID=UPI000A34ABB3|nr:ABC transporter substrate-binding protein [Acinetobacter sp. ANC 4558]OTG84159.1 nitrate ABC transporter substrate-binding protein [Acinetobacter sp. ANC 4558]
MRIILRVLLSLSFIGLLACNQSKNNSTNSENTTSISNKQQLRIAVVANGTSGKLDFIGVPELISKDEIFLNQLKQENIELQWEPVTTAAVATLVNESFINNKIDFAFYGNLPAVVLNASGIRTQLIVPGNIGNNIYLVVPPNSPAKNIHDLKGKKIALHRGRPWEINFSQLIESEGLNFKDFQIINLNPQAGAAALSAKSVDAFFTLSDALTLQDRKLGKIIWSSQSLPAEWKMRAELWGRQSYIEQHPKVTQQLADATVRAMYWISQNKDEYQLSQTKFGQPLSVIQRESNNTTSTWKKDWFPNYQIPFLTQHYQRVIDHAVKNQLIQTPIKSDELLNSKFTDQAIQNLQVGDYWDQP